MRLNLFYCRQVLILVGLVLLCCILVLVVNVFELLVHLGDVCFQGHQLMDRDVLNVGQVLFLVEKHLNTGLELQDVLLYS
jgi:hypothetical protein